MSADYRVRLCVSVHLHANAHEEDGNSHSPEATKPASKQTAKEELGHSRGCPRYDCHNTSSFFCDVVVFVELAIR